MFLILLAAIFSCIGMVLTWIPDGYFGPISTWPLTVMLVCFGLFFLIIVLPIKVMYNHSEQYDDFTKIIKYREIKEIYQKKARDLTTEFASYLAERYPEIEKKIFESLSPDKIDFYIATYPQIKSSDTIMDLVKRIDQLQSDVYEQDKKIAEKKAEILYRKLSSWNIRSLIPSLEDLEKEVQVASEA
ncbi:MAG: hypothetical protein ABH884_00010 [Candidatus Komeilibacteria bacterium]